MASHDTAPSREPGSAPILDLDTLIVRPTISIDGALFEMLSPDEISVIDCHRFTLWGRRIEELATVPGEEAEAELNDLIGQVARKVLVGVPAEVFDKLTGAHRWAVVDVFTGLLLGKRLSLAGAMQRAMGPAIDALRAGGPSTGATPSRGSSGSTAVSRHGGWAKRLARWCGLS